MKSNNSHKSDSFFWDQKQGKYVRKYSYKKKQKLETLQLASKVSEGSKQG